MTVLLVAASDRLAHCRGKPKTSYVELDRTGTDHLNTGEYCDRTTGDLAGRVASWPLG